MCIQIINLDLSLEGERLICYVLETLFDFPFLSFFFFFFSQQQREMLVLSRLSLKLKGTLTPSKSSQQPLTPKARRATDHSNTGISNAPWDLKSLSKDIS